MLKRGPIVFLMLIISSIFIFSQKIYINEFLASNVTIIADMVDFSDYADWIELYNSENYDVNLSGYFLKDNRNDTAKWLIPEGTVIESKKYLFLWADGEDAKPGDRFVRPFDNSSSYAEYYHTNFKLSKEGEEIALYNPEGVIVDYISFGIQLNDVSFGRKPDGSSSWYFFGEPTPNASNSTEGLTNLIYAEMPQISPEGNMYTSTQTISLSTTSGLAKIHYTTDGSIPTSKSTIYNSLISVNTTTVIRARVFETGKLPSKVITQTYFINEPNTKLPVISFSTDPYYLWDDDKGIYENILKLKEIPISLEYYESYGNKSFTVNAGSRIAGLNIWRFAQKPLTVYLRSKYGDEAINYPIFKEKPQVGKITKLVLRNAGDDWSGAYFRDAMMQHIPVGKMDNVLQAYQPALLYLNGEFWGLINIREKFDEQYFTSNYNVAPNNIDHLQYAYDEYHNFNLYTEIGDDTDYKEMIDFLENNNMAIKNNFDYIASLMDIESYVDWAIAEIYIENTSWRHNQEWWRQKTNEGKWKWMIVDLDRGFNMDNISRNMVDDLCENIPTGSTYGDPILKNLLNNTDFKNYFIQRFVTHLNSTFNQNRVINIIDSLQLNIEYDMPKHIERWKNDGGISSMVSWKEDVEELREFARQRPQYIYSQLSEQFDLNGTINLIVNVEPKSFGKVYINNVLVTDTSFHAKYFKNIPINIKAVPDIGHKFLYWQGIQDGSSMEKIINPASDLNITAVFELSDETILSSIINENTILNLENSPYLTRGDIIVNPGITLQINEGVEILMPENASFYIYGNLLVNGTKINPVTIKPNLTIEADEWGAICFKNTTDTSKLNYLILEKATKGNDPYKFFAAISSYHSNLIMDHITIENISTQPIYTQFGHIELKNSKTHSYGTCDHINIKYADYALVENCDFRGNNAFDTDAIDYDQISGGIIRNNLIHDFEGFNSDAIDLGEELENVYVYKNFIYNCTDKGVSVGQASSAIIENNIIIGCNMGVGIKDFNSFAFINKNTFYGNNIGIACYEKNFLEGGGSATVSNTIIADSRTSPYFIDDYGTIDISYSLSNNVELPGEGNVFSDPLLVNPVAHNLRLLKNSPCINAGDPNSPNDPDNSRADIGAFYYIENSDYSIVINEINYHCTLNYDPGEWIELYNATNTTCDISDWTLEDYNSGETYVLPQGTTLFPDDYLVISRDTVKFKAYYDNVTNFIGNLNFSFDNSGELITLYNKNKEVVDSMTYGDKFPWPEEADGMGFTLSLIKPYLDNSFAGNWMASLIPGGSPGQTNSFIPGFSDLYINEFLALNDSLNADEFGEYDDWIEIYNNSDFPLSVAGLYITDDFTQPRKYRIPNTDPQKTTILPKGFLLLWADNDTDQGLLHLNFRLDGQSEEIGLVSLNGIDFIDSVSFQSQKSKISFGRQPDGSKNWIELIPSPSHTNNYTSIENLFTKKGLEENILIFPNPANRNVNISLNNIYNSKVKIEIINTLGQIIDTKTYEVSNSLFLKSLDLAPEMQGLYFIRITVNNMYTVKKLIVN
ncbi:MAG: lamin tail domain-containing protein [Bacteroidales bacterium]|nr:lamin tail domain-containing protein [Bacteroidales bacterium]